MSDDKCIVAQRPTWQLTTLRPAAYSTSRQYSAFAASLLQFFSLHRSATARQVQRAFAGRFGGERSVRMHLQTLARRGDLAVLRGQNLTSPNIYVVTRKGLGSAGERPTETRTGRRRSTGNHLVHELLITEFAVWLQEEVERRSSVRLSWQDRFGLTERPCFRDLVPDYGFLFEHREGRLVCLVEVSSGEESPTRLRQKLEAYDSWTESDVARQFLVELYRQHGAREPRANYRSLWVMHNRLAGADDVRLKQLVQAASNVPAGMRNRVWCTTAAALSQLPAKPQVWLRLADLESVMDGRRPGRGRQWRHELSRCMEKAPRHSLFPTVEIVR